MKCNNGLKLINQIFLLLLIEHFLFEMYPYDTHLKFQKQGYRILCFRVKMKQMKDPSLKILRSISQKIVVFNWKNLKTLWI